MENTTPQPKLPRPRVTLTIILLNVVVYLMWNLPLSAEQEPLFMVNNFLVSWTGLEEGRIWTTLTSVFSHNMFWHLFLNMYVLNSFGSVIEGILGPMRFLRFYLLAGIFSSLCHCLVSAFILAKPDLPALGASGAISAIVIFFSLVFPKAKVYLFALVPIPALWAALVFVGLDLWGLVAQAEGGGLPIGHGAHLGGALAGLFYFALLRSRFQQSRRSRIS